MACALIPACRAPAASTPAAVAVATTAGAALSATPTASVMIQPSAKRVGMGRCLQVTAEARLPGGKSAAGWRLLPFVNHRRWGSEEHADASGRAVFLLPLPRPGWTSIRVLALPPVAEADDYWIWPASKQNVAGPVYLQRVFSLPDGATGGSLWLAVDDSATVYLNGKQIAQKGGWHDIKPTTLPASLFHRGQNILSVDAVNGAGPAGLLMRLTAHTRRGDVLIVTDTDWSGFVSKPAGWPGAAAETGGVKVGTYGTSTTGGVRPQPWPTIAHGYFLSGTPAPEKGDFSNRIAVQVYKRKLQCPPNDPSHPICVQWEPWFTPLNNTWGTAEAVPLMGYYQSSERDVCRQHLIWFMESGLTAILADWSNHIWHLQSWSDISQGSWQIIHNTTLMMDVMAKMRDEGYPVPKMTLLIGISYARPGGPNAVNGELKYIWDTYIADPKYKGLWQYFDGKPLVEVLDLGASYLKQGIKLDNRFTIRYVGVSQDINPTAKLGLWTWMDSLHPVPTMRNGVAEAMTISIGSFAQGGWLGPHARGHRNGSTLVEDTRYALKYRPRFLHIHQFNEFAGQPEGAGTGPNHNHYVDTYSAELSDDFEPTSLTEPAYRGDGGWGYYYLNLVRAVVDLYRQPKPETTILAISDPVPAAPGLSMVPKVSGKSTPVKWEYVGRKPQSYTLSLDGRVVARDTKAETATLNLRGVSAGRHWLKLVANGTTEHYVLSWTRDSLPLKRPQPASTAILIDVVR